MSANGEPRYELEVIDDLDTYYRNYPEYADPATYGDYPEFDPTVSDDELRQIWRVRAIANASGAVAITH